MFPALPFRWAFLLLLNFCPFSIHLVLKWEKFFRSGRKKKRKIKDLGVHFQFDLSCIGVRMRFMLPFALPFSSAFHCPPLSFLARFWPPWRSYSFTLSHINTSGSFTADDWPQFVSWWQSMHFLTWVNAGGGYSLRLSAGTRRTKQRETHCLV